MSDAGGFGEVQTRRVLAEVCRLAGFDADGAVLLRLGENAIYELKSAPVVVRIAPASRDVDSVRREVAAARWLADVSLDAGRLVGGIEQPLVVGGHAVTLWESVEQVPPHATIAELGAVLRELHRLPVPADLDLPRFQIMARVPGRIETSSVLSNDDRTFLLTRYRELQAAYDALDFPAR